MKETDEILGVVASEYTRLACRMLIEATIRVDRIESDEAKKECAKEISIDIKDCLNLLKKIADILNQKQ